MLGAWCLLYVHLMGLICKIHFIDGHITATLLHIDKEVIDGFLHDKFLGIHTSSHMRLPFV